MLWLERDPKLATQSSKRKQLCPCPPRREHPNMPGPLPGPPPPSVGGVQSSNGTDTARGRPLHSWSKWPARQNQPMGRAKRQSWTLLQPVGICSVWRSDWNRTALQNGKRRCPALCLPDSPLPAPALLPNCRGGALLRWDGSNGAPGARPCPN